MRLRNLISLSLALLLGCGLIAPQRGSAQTPAGATPTLEEQIGQLLMVGFRGLQVGADDAIVRDIRRYHLGGVILFDRDVALGTAERNVASPAQLHRLIASLQQAAAVPLLVAVDQEGGRVARLKPGHGFPPTVSARFLGERDDLELTWREADRIAATLAGAGINLNLAPVIDLLSNPDNPVIARLERSFATDPQSVADQAAAVIAAHHRHGVLCAVKHFPGHGSSRDDSHLGVVDVSATWSERELEPYRLLFSMGLPDAVMTAHLYNRRLDPQHPATLSALTVDGLLRGRLGYQGVVISDDLQMGAIRAAYSWEQTVTAALAAGVDILLIGNNLNYEADIVPRTVALIRRLVAEGKISPQRIDTSWRRIQALKARLRPAVPAAPPTMLPRVEPVGSAGAAP